MTPWVAGRSTGYMQPQVVLLLTGLRVDGRASENRGPDRLVLSGRFAAHDLSGVRGAVLASVLGWGLPADCADCFVLAVNEAVTNVIRYADGQGELVLFDEPDQVVAEITDRGPGFLDGYDDWPPPPDALGGRGLWLMRLCVDQVGVVASATGTRVRLAVRRPR
jgi:anti-sigma regulatory factor (Ser/Thr protein kinase)